MNLPAFLPDGTIGVVRSVDCLDLKKAGVEGIVTSTFHLLVNNVKTDLHKLMNWDGIILTDSGGFQVYSLLRDHPKSGQITDEGFKFSWNSQKIFLTPEESIKQQLRLGSDILICLDQCTDPKMDEEFQKQAVEITINWARRCKEELQKTKVKNKKLFAVIQGGNYKKLRKYCAEELIKIGFDGYCYGGWPSENCQFLSKILEYTAKLMPDNLPKFALGVGRPRDIIKCFKMGYQIFDCVIPTREARHKRLYVWCSRTGLEYKTLILNAQTSSKKLVSLYCDCYTCQNYTISYLYHLFQIKESLAFRLATIHNLRFYTQLMERLR